jgi:NDP-sugar pyrophosphorylase family protein
LNVKSRLREFLSKKVSLGEGSWIAPNATVLGDVRIGVQSSVWYQSVLRGDINYIEIGKCTNLQDGVIGHLSDDYPLIVGDYVTVGHGAVIHACKIGDECLIRNECNNPRWCYYWKTVNYSSRYGCTHRYGCARGDLSLRVFRVKLRVC